jgi:4-hydroxy-3-methylbut-2-enyl diphosphate reductase
MLCDTKFAMKIIRAHHLGMCFGVRNAIALALQQAANNPLTILGDLVHNETVLEELRRNGVRIERKLEDVKTPHLMITAHGASNRTINAARERGFQVTEATCPLVHYAHQALARLVADGFYPVVIGQRQHVEVRGLTGDLEEYNIVLNEDDILELPAKKRYGVVAQTTQPLERVRQLAELIGRRFPDAEVRLVDTVCKPTKQRQAAAVELARQCNAVVVVGGANSNNTRELVSACARYCPRVYHIQTAADLQPGWFHDTDVVGLTAGTSTPDNVIDEVEARLREWNAPRAAEAEPAASAS